MVENEDAGVNPRIEVEPLRSLADEPVSIRLRGFEPQRRVTLRASMRDDSGNQWSSHAEFETDSSGQVDLGTAEPSSGTYRGADAMGLFWSMKPSKRKPIPFKVENIDPKVITITAESGGGEITALELERIYAAPGVGKVAVSGEGLVGTFFKPPLEGPQPGLIVLHGTAARIMEDVGSILASRGFAVLAPLYFGKEGLPDELIGVPLEYFERVIYWMQSREEVRGDRLGVIGMSRGGELALLVGSTFKQLKAVVSASGSSVVFEGLHKDPRKGGAESPWSYQGNPLPFMERKENLGFVAGAIWAGVTGRPFSTANTYEAAMTDRDAVERAAIKVERIGGPVMFTSGGQDQVWPSARLSQIGVERLASHKHPFPYEHLTYDGAGHGIGLPYRPTTMNLTVTFSGTMLHFGGSPQENARACADSWPKVVEFLRSHLEGVDPRA